MIRPRDVKNRIVLEPQPTKWFKKSGRLRLSGNGSESLRSLCGFQNVVGQRHSVAVARRRLHDRYRVQMLSPFASITREVEHLATFAYTIDNNGLMGGLGEDALGICAPDGRDFPRSRAPIDSS